MRKTLREVGRFGAGFGNAGALSVASRPTSIRIVRAEESQNLPLRILGRASRA